MRGHRQETIDIAVKPWVNVADFGPAGPEIYRSIVAEFVRRTPNLRMIDNPMRLTPSALNIGIEAARGSIIIRMDAHSAYPRHYVPRLVWWLSESGADNVGGSCITIPANDSVTARARSVMVRDYGHPARDATPIWTASPSPGAIPRSTRGRSLSRSATTMKAVKTAAAARNRTSSTCARTSGIRRTR